MNFNDLKSMKSNGFSGFVKISDLFLNDSVIPKEKGTYMVLSIDGSMPAFVSKGTGGFLKVKTLIHHWIS